MRSAPKVASASRQQGLTFRVLAVCSSSVLTACPLTDDYFLLSSGQGGSASSGAAGEAPGASGGTDGSEAGGVGGVGGVGGAANTGGTAGAAAGGDAGSDSQAGGAGGDASADAGDGNLGGAGGTGGTSSAAAGEAGAAGTTNECKSYGSVCWYLGGLDESCEEVCSSHGGVAPESIALVGTAAQGGSAAHCIAVMELLGIDLVVRSGSRSDGIGVGCHLWSGEAWWLRSPDLSSESSSPKAEIACGCVR